MNGQFPDAKPRGIPYSFEYRLPEEFVKMPDPGTTDGWAQAMAQLMPNTDEEQQAFAAEQMRAYLPWLYSREETTIALAMCFGVEQMSGEDRLSMGLLTVSVGTSGHNDRLLTAEGIYQTKRKALFAEESELQELDFALGKGLQGEQDMLLAAMLPCGPGVMSTSLRSLKLTDAVGEEEAIAMAALQLIIPAPRDYCVYITLSTPSVYLLDSYSGRLAHIGRTFSFDVPDTDAVPTSDISDLIAPDPDDKRAKRAG